MRLEFHGVRGGLPTPGKQTVKYGGNTTCFSIRTRSNDLLIFDAGTGIQALGARIMQEEFRDSLAVEAFVEFIISGHFELAQQHLETLKTNEANKPFKPDVHLFLTHFHWDHIQGLPFFVPLYVPGRNFNIYGPLKADHRLVDALRGQMSRTYFPIRYDSLRSSRKYTELLEDTVQINDTVITCRPLNHPQGSLGYRIASGERSIVIAVDTEHPADGKDESLIALAEGADVFVYDAQYTPEEYELKRHWGHSTWQEGVKVAREAGAKKLVLCHHDTSHSDEFLDTVLNQAREQFPDVCMATEGSVISLKPGTPTAYPRDASAEDRAAQQMPALDIRGDTLTVRCTPTFHSLALPEFRSRLDEMIRYGARSARFVCSDVAYYSGQGLTHLADTIRILTDHRVRTTLEKIPAALHSRLTDARFQHVAELENPS